MDLTKPGDLDALVRAALAEGPNSPLPFGLQRRIENRVRVVDLLHKERRRFSYYLAACALALLVLVGGVVLAALLAGLAGVVMGMVPGGMGYFDYLAISLELAWSRLIEYATSIVGVVTLALLVLALIPVRLLAGRRIF